MNQPKLSSIFNQNGTVQSINLTLSSHPLMDMGDCCKKLYDLKLLTDTAGILNRS